MTDRFGGIIQRFNNAIGDLVLEERQDSFRVSSNHLDHSLRRFKPTMHRILKLVAEHMTSGEIADILSISQRTVDNHRSNICRKLGLNGINSLLHFALTHRAER